MCVAAVSVKGADAATVGELVNGITSTCPDAAAALQSTDFSLLNTLVGAVSNVEVTLPDGKKEIVVAPSNAAVEAYLAKNGATLDGVLADQDALADLILTHIAVATNNGASQADTAAGSRIRLITSVPDGKVSLQQIPAGTAPASDIIVKGPMNTVSATQTINCDGNKYILATDGVLVPKPLTAAMAPGAMAPVVDVVADAPMMDAVMDIPPVADAPIMDAVMDIPPVADAPIMDIIMDGMEPEAEMGMAPETELFAEPDMPAVVPEPEAAMPEPEIAMPEPVATPTVETTSAATGIKAAASIISVAFAAVLGL